MPTPPSRGADPPPPPRLADPPLTPPDAWGTRAETRLLDDEGSPLIFSGSPPSPPSATPLCFSRSPPAANKSSHCKSGLEVFRVGCLDGPS